MNFEDQKPTINVSTIKDEIRVGRGYITLQDQSEESYRTDHLDSFLAVVENLKGSHLESGMILIYTADEVYLRSSLFHENPRVERELALLTLKESPELRLVQNINGRKLPLKEFEQVLRRLRRWMGPSVTDLIDHIRDFRVSKVTKINRKKQKNGDYTFLVSRESNGDDDFLPPNSVPIRVPLFADQPQCTVDIEMDFEFDYDARAEEVSTSFMLECLSLDDAIRRANIEAVAGLLADTGIKAVRGHIDLQLKDDSWSYMDNGPERKR
jgi:hypothetical protein